MLRGWGGRAHKWLRRVGRKTWHALTWKRAIDSLVLVILLMIIGFLFRLIPSPIHVSLINYVGQEEPNYSPQKDGSEPSLLGDYPNWGQFFVALATLWFSYWLIRLGRLQSRLLKRANATSAKALSVSGDALEESRKANMAANRSAKAAEDAVDVTRRSVDLDVAYQRGRMVYWNSLPSNSFRTINYTFRNAGRTPVFVLTFSVDFGGFDVIWSEKDGLGMEIPAHKDRRHQRFLILPDHYIGTIEPFEGAQFNSRVTDMVTNVPEDKWKEMMTKRYVVFHYLIRYETISGEVYRLTRASAWKREDPSGEFPIPHAFDMFCDDRLERKDENGDS